MTDKPFDHEEYSRERLQQTTPGDGSDFKGHLVHRPGEVVMSVCSRCAQPWEANMPSPEWLAGPYAKNFVFKHDCVDALHVRHEADQQTIADLRAETERWQEFANGYMRDLTAAEQTIAELRKALETLLVAAKGVFKDGGIEVDSEDCLIVGIEQIMLDNLVALAEALAAIAATEEDKPS